jgi:hypothetical protein
MSGKIAHHLHQVILRYIISLCDFADGAQAVRMRGQIEHHAHGIIRETGQAHGLPP